MSDNIGTVYLSNPEEFLINIGKSFYENLHRSGGNLVYERKLPEIMDYKHPWYKIPKFNPLAGWVDEMSMPSMEYLEHDEYEKRVIGVNVVMEVWVKKDNECKE